MDSTRLAILNSYEPEWQVLRVYWTKTMKGGWVSERSGQDILYMWMEYVNRVSVGVKESRWELPGDHTREFTSDSRWGMWGGLWGVVPEETHVRDYTELEDWERGELYWRARRLRRAIGAISRAYSNKWTENFHEQIGLVRTWCERVSRDNDAFKEAAEYAINETLFWERATSVWERFVKWDDFEMGTYTTVFGPRELPYYMWLTGDQKAAIRAFKKVRADLKQRTYQQGDKPELRRAMGILDGVLDLVELIEGKNSEDYRPGKEVPPPPRRAF